MRVSEPAFRFVTRDEFHEGYTLKEDYLQWLQKNNKKKINRVMRKLNESEASVSSMSRSSRPSSDDMGSGDDQEEEVEAIDGGSDGMLEVANYPENLEATIGDVVEKTLKKAKFNDDRHSIDMEQRNNQRFSDLEQRLAAHFDYFNQRLDKSDTETALLGQKLNDGISTILAAISSKQSTAQQPAPNGFTPMQSTPVGSPPPHMHEGGVYGYMPPPQHYPSNHYAGYPMSGSSAGHSRHDRALYMMKIQRAQVASQLKSVASFLEQGDEIIFY